MSRIVEHKEYLLVELPEGADSIEFHDEEMPRYITYHIGMGTEDYDILRETLPEGFYTLIGKADQLDEYQCSDIISIELLEYWKEANKALFSLLRASGLDSPEQVLIIKKI